MWYFYCYAKQASLLGKTTIKAHLQNAKNHAKLVGFKEQKKYTLQF